MGIALAVIAWLGLLGLRVWVLDLSITWQSTALELLIVVLGSAIFWWWIISILNRNVAQVQHHTQRLEALHAASVALTTEHDLTVVLQKVVDLARNLIKAKYGALGVLDESGKYIDQFVTSGMSTAVHERIGRLPQGRGILGVPLSEGRSVRLASIEDDPRSVGFPANHPHMRSFIGVPIVSKGRIFGNLYLTDKLPDLTVAFAEYAASGVAEFTELDQILLEMFATQAAIAIENAQLYRQNQQIAILQERERFGMDLHDGVIQSIYAIGLMLDDSRHRVETEPKQVQARIDDAIINLNRVIADIRNYIRNLRSHHVPGRNLQQGLEELVRNLQMYSTLHVDLNLDSDAVAKISPHQTSELLHIAQEALANVRKHAHASSVNIELRQMNHHLELDIRDDGYGFEPATAGTGGGHGLKNMAERVRTLDGTLAIESAEESGTRIAVCLPIAS